MREREGGRKRERENFRNLETLEREGEREGGEEGGERERLTERERKAEER